MSSTLEEFGRDVVKYAKEARKQGRITAPPESDDGMPEIVSIGIPNQWSIVGKDDFVATSSTQKKLPAGLYTFGRSEIGWHFLKREINIDEILRFPDSVADQVVSEIEHFWTLKDEFKKYGFLHRRGIIFYGPAGAGKTFVVQQIVRDVIARDGIAFSMSVIPGEFDSILKLFREVEPARHIVCIFEDIDAIIDSHGEEETLSLLDGENQIDDALNIATTNYPERLDKRIVARPRRFDRVIKIDMPSKEVRKIYLQHKLKNEITEDELEKWVNMTSGFSFAALADLVISTRCLGNDLEKSVEALKNLMIKKSSNEYDFQTTGNFGFGGEDGEI